MNNSLNQYQREAILAASPARLLTMLYDRLMLDLSRAQAAQHQQDWNTASAELLHAQSIVTELQSSLKPELWNGAEQLQALYSFVTGLLIRANTERDAALTAEAATLLEPLRQAWHEAAAAPVQGNQNAAAAVSPSALAIPAAPGDAGGSGSLLGVG